MVSKYSDRRFCPFVELCYKNAIFILQGLVTRVHVGSWVCMLAARRIRAAVGSEFSLVNERTCRHLGLSKKIDKLETMVLLCLVTVLGQGGGMEISAQSSSSWGCLGPDSPYES